jgi:hypothetical protein
VRDLYHFPIQQDLTAHGRDARRHFLPHLAGSEFRIKKTFAQQRPDILLGDILLTPPCQALEEMDDALEMERFLTLCAPH